MQVDAVLLDCDWSGSDVAAISDARAAVELPGVPRADNDVAVQRTLGQGSASVFHRDALVFGRSADGVRWDSAIW